MKRHLFLILFLIGSIHIVSAQLKSEVNECFELTSIVFRLSGVKEYVNNQLTDYTNEIDNYFSKHKNHKLISFINEIRRTKKIVYGDIPAAAAYIEIKNGKVQLRPDIDILQSRENNGRWTNDSLKEFVNLLNDFYHKTKFRKFYTQHLDMYKIAEERMNQLLLNFNTEWFKSVLGNHVKPPLVVISLCNGPHNYSLNIPYKENNYVIVIGSGSDRKGMPAFSEGQLFVITHEYLHKYTNPLIYNNWSQIDSIAEALFTHVQEDMRKNAYGDAKTVMCEWLTNLLSVMYAKENLYNLIRAEDLIADLQNRGFIWMDRSFSFINYFNNNREKYPTIEYYIPQLIGFLKYTAYHYDQVLSEYNNRSPYVVETYPVNGSTITLETDTIIFRFSEKMADMYNIKPVGDESIIRIPWSVMPQWSKDYSSLYIPLDKDKIVKGKTYGVRLIRRDLQSYKAYPMKEDFIYTFKIAEK